MEFQKWLEANNLDYRHVADQHKTYDFLVDWYVDGNWFDDVAIDVKTYSKNSIFVEPIASIDPPKPGWFYSSEAHIYVFTNKNNPRSWWLWNDDRWKNWYRTNKNNYELTKNKPTIGMHGDRWQSAYRRIPILDLIGSDFFLGVDLERNKLI